MAFLASQGVRGLRAIQGDEVYERQRNRLLRTDSLFFSFVPLNPVLLPFQIAVIIVSVIMYVAVFRMTGMPAFLLIFFTNGLLTWFFGRKMITKFFNNVGF